MFSGLSEEAMGADVDGYRGVSRQAAVLLLFFLQRQIMFSFQNARNSNSKNNLLEHSHFSGNVRDSYMEVFSLKIHVLYMAILH